jgi:hypothetical protein
MTHTLGLTMVFAGIGLIGLALLSCSSEILAYFLSRKK